MLDWLVHLWQRIDRWMRGQKLPEHYHRSNLHRRNR